MYVYANDAQIYLACVLRSNYTKWECDVSHIFARIANIVRLVYGRVGHEYTALIVEHFPHF